MQGKARTNMKQTAGDIVRDDVVGGSNPPTPTIFAHLSAQQRVMFPVCARMTSVLKSSGRAVRQHRPDPNHANLIRRSDMATPFPITLAYFWSKVRIPDNLGDCWEWKATLNETGYGRFRTAGKKVATHRFAYEHFNGAIPEGMQIRHLCHNRRCCNPAHLTPGTAKENAQDAIDAGRFTRGTTNGNSKLQETDVIAIRQNADRLTTRQLAERFGVSTGTISEVRTGKVWRHILTPPS
jgi:DNA-binding transcriptional regulator YiaG